LAAKSGATERVLNVKGGSVSSSSLTPLISWAANEAHQNSQFRLQGMEWLAMGGRCVIATKRAAGAELGLNPCGGHKWDFFDGNRRIKLRGDEDLCVEVPGGATANGTKLTLAKCSTSANQKFTFADGKIGFSNKTFNVAGGSIAAGSRIVLWSPSAGQPYPNERFTVMGQVRSLGQCVDMSGAANPGVGIGVRTCSDISDPFESNTNTQVWEYWW
jgi:hypothetical protein